MCFFIAVQLSEEQAAIVAPLLAPAGQLRRFGARSAERSPGTYLIIDDLCSCRLYSTADDERVRPESALERRARRYRRMGWSKAKIERALGQHATHARAKAERRPEFSGLHPQVRSALKRLARETGPFRLLVKWTAGQFALDELESGPARPIAAADLAMGEVEVDAVYQVVPRG
jgi:hypothetical protein